MRSVRKSYVVSHTRSYRNMNIWEWGAQYTRARLKTNVMRAEASTSGHTCAWEHTNPHPYTSGEHAHAWGACTSSCTWAQSQRSHEGEFPEFQVAVSTTSSEELDASYNADYVFAFSLSWQLCAFLKILILTFSLLLLSHLSFPWNLVVGQHRASELSLQPPGPI